MITDKISVGKIRTIRRSAWLVGILLFLFSTAFAQNLPKEIRGYKVHRADISVENETGRTAAKKKAAATVKIGEPELIGVSLAGVAFEISAEITGLQQNGTVDFLTFEDFRVNGLPVAVEEYRESFKFKKNQSVVLPKPIKIRIGAGNTLRGALREVNESKTEWTVTGSVFVFGQFKKSFLKFKRVVPIEINLKIKNPLKYLGSR